MQSLSLTLGKRLSNSKPLLRISSNLVAYASTTSSSSPSSSPPISAAAVNGSASTLSNLLTAPWSATQSRGVSVSGSDVRVGNLIENRGRSYEVLKLYRSLEGTGKDTIKVPPHSVAGYATVATAGDDIKSVMQLKVADRDDIIFPFQRPRHVVFNQNLSRFAFTAPVS